MQHLGLLHVDLHASMTIFLYNLYIEVVSIFLSVVSPILPLYNDC